MSSAIEYGSDQSARQNLTWLFLLRNFLIAGESLLLVVTVYLIAYQIPERLIWAIISVAMIVNSLTWYRLQHDHPVTELELFVHLIFDVMGITAILYCTGGAANPFAWFFILPLVITATVLPHIYTGYILGLTSVCYTLLTGYNIPLADPRLEVDTKNLPKVVLDLQSQHFIDLHVFVLWFGFLLIAGIVAYFVVKMTDTLREREKTLAKAREQVLRDERVIALGALAAGAAHELGTPLGTMAILAHDIKQEYPKEEFADLQSKMQIFDEQIERCKNALAVMSASAGDFRAESGHVMPLEEYLDDVVLQWRDQRPFSRLEYRSTNSAFAPPALVADRTLTQALINILNNAADASPAWVGFEFDWNSKEIVIEILDKGPGFDPEIIESLGKQPVSTKQQGLGVGLFLAYSTIHRLGGSLEIFNLPETGACSKITLPAIQNSESL